jgi:hypothetical protein
VPVLTLHAVSEFANASKPQAGKQHIVEVRARRE